MNARRRAAERGTGETFRKDGDSLLGMHLLSTPMRIDQWAELARSLTTLHTAFNKSAQLSCPIGPGSQAGEECQQDTLADEWGDQPARDAHLAALPAVLSVLDHLDSMSTLFRSPGGITTSHTIARAALDIAIRPWYLLEPGIGGRERVRRYMNLRLQSLKEQSQLDQSSKGNIRGHSEERMERIIRSARKHGFDVRRPGHRYNPPHLGAEIPKTTKLASKIVSEENPSLGALFWRLGSAVAHGHQHGFALFFGGADQPAEPTSDAVGKHMQVSAKDTALMCGGAPLAAISMLRRLYAQCGWETDTLETAIGDTLTTWQRVAGAHKQARIPNAFLP